MPRKAIDTKVLQAAIDDINSVLDSDPLTIDPSLDAQMECLQKLKVNVAAAVTGHMHEAGERGIPSIAQIVKELAPVADCIIKAQSMLQNETLLVFVSPVPTRVIRLQIYKVEFLFHVVELLVRNGVVLLSLFFNARNTEGIPLIVPWLQKPAVASSCGDDFGAMMEYAANPMEFNIILLELYNSLPIFLHNPLSIRTLPRSPMLKEALLAHAMCFMGYMLDQGLKSSSSMCPLFVVTVTHTNRVYYDRFLFNDLLGSLEMWDTMRPIPGPDKKSRFENRVTTYCLGITRVLQKSMIPADDHEDTIYSLTGPKSLMIMGMAGQDFMKASQNGALEDGTQLDQEERIDLAVAGTTLLAFKVYIHTKHYSSIPEHVVVPEPIDMLEALVPLSQAWVQCAICLATNTSQDHLASSMTYIAYNALHDCARGVLTRLDVEKLKKPSENMVIAVFKAQEAVSTMISIAAWIFVTFQSQDEEDFKKNKRWIFDIIAEAGKLNDVLTCISLEYSVVSATVKKSAAACVQGLRAVECSSKALLWWLKISPVQLLDFTNEYCPLYRGINDGMKISKVESSLLQKSLDDETADYYFPASLYQSIHNALAITLKCCPLYEHGSTTVDGELEKLVGATMLKAFFAMEIKPENGWVDAMHLDVFSIRSESYANLMSTIFAVAQESNLSTVTLPLLKSAVLPILATNEPWLENALEYKNSDQMMDDDEKVYVQFCKEMYENGMNEVVSGGEVQEQRAIARAEAMATLQCAFVGCRAVSIPGEKSKFCGGCKVVKYCSEGCMKADWKKNHKFACKAMAAGK